MRLVGWECAKGARIGRLREKPAIPPEFPFRVRCSKNAGVTAEAHSGRATLLVRPFEAPPDEAGRDYFVRGFVDDLIGDFARFSDLRVISAHSSSAHGSSAAQVSADFVLTGGLRRAGDQLRVSTRLCDGRNGQVLWAEHFDRPTGDLFDVQDEIVARVVAAVSTRINAALLVAARRKPKTELVAYDHWLRGHDHLKRGTARADEDARRCFEAALECDPSYARAYLGLSLSHFNEWSCQLWPRWDENEKHAFAYAERASELDPDDHYAELVLGRVLLFRREFERAEQHIERSLLLNRNDADCLVQIGFSLALLGQAERGAELYERAVALNPLHQPWYLAYSFPVSFCLDRFEETLAAASRLPGDIMVDCAAYRAAALHHLGRKEAAREALNAYLKEFAAKIVPGREPEPGEALRWLQHVNPYRNPEDERRLVDAVAAVGLSSGEHKSPVVTAPERRAFRKVGSLWQVSFEGQDAWLPNLKGFGDIRTLLDRAGHDVHCSELLGGVVVLDEDERIDERARVAYRERAQHLRNAFEEAEQHNDWGRAERARAELEALGEHLSSALGVGGRSRKLDATVDRARSAVTQRIRGAIKRLQGVHEPLARHFERAIQTGVFCSYRPENSVDWGP